MKKNNFFISVNFIVLLFFYGNIMAQAGYWQQEVSYQMSIEMFPEINQYEGVQKIFYINNSPDTLNKLFFHLQWNAFQPGSMMDVRSRTIADSDPRVGDRISKLSKGEIGFQVIDKLLVNGEEVNYQTEGTILEVHLDRPLLPNTKTMIDMDWHAQVPLQIRRSGRDNAEGIRYSMTQWYPKLAEYDDMGWHADPYIGREFYGVYGDFDVTIHIDNNYIIGGTGNLVNNNEIGFGYQDEGIRMRAPLGKKNAWRFRARKVHDFAWAADPDYKHISLKREDGTMLHFLYQPKDEFNEKDWKQLPKIIDKALGYIEPIYGEYPYRQYTFIQGGDGGMEYPMATLITGHRPLKSLVGVSIHELFHSWYQGVLGTNEALYAWMDEGFTSYASAMTMNYLVEKGMLPGEVAVDPILSTIRGMENFNSSGQAEPLSTHADHFRYNSGYSVASYVKGSAFLHQIRYIIGEKAFNKGMLRYYDTWSFKHPRPNDFVRIMEKESGMELDWFLQSFINTTYLPDYSIKEVEKKEKKQTKVTLENRANFAMPIELLVTYKNGDKERYYIPLQSMRGTKPFEDGITTTTMEDWGWVYPTYNFVIDAKIKKIESIVIDPSRRMSDTNLKNNQYPTEKQ